MKHTTKKLQIHCIYRDNIYNLLIIITFFHLFFIDNIIFFNNNIKLSLISQMKSTLQKRKDNCSIRKMLLRIQGLLMNSVFFNKAISDKLLSSRFCFLLIILSINIIIIIIIIELRNQETIILSIKSKFKNSFFLLFYKLMYVYSRSQIVKIFHEMQQLTHLK